MNRRCGPHQLAVMSGTEATILAGMLAAAAAAADIGKPVTLENTPAVNAGEPDKTESGECPAAGALGQAGNTPANIETGHAPKTLTAPVSLRLLVCPEAMSPSSSEGARRFLPCSVSAEGVPLLLRSRAIAMPALRMRWKIEAYRTTRN